MVSHGLSLLNADVTQILSNAKITFSQGGAEDLQGKYWLPEFNQT